MHIIADLHTHSISSGHAYSTVLEMVKAAEEKGLQAMALTDHGPGMPGAPDLYHFGNMRVLPEIINSVRLFKGVEANIINIEGHLDMPVNYLMKMDLVLAGMHDVVTPYGSVEDNTQTIINAMRNPYVDIVVHPGNPVYSVNHDLVVQTAKDLGVVIEINNSSFCGSRRGSTDNCRLIAKLVAAKGNTISIGSDAHFAPDVGRFDYALATVEEAGIIEEQILNASIERIVSYLKDRRSKRPK